MMCLSSGFHFTVLCLRLSYPVSRHFPSAAVPPPPCYTHVSRSREARRVSAIRGTHLQMPHLHHLRRDDPLGIQRTNCYARDDYVTRTNERFVYAYMNPFAGRVALLKPSRMLLLKHLVKVAHRIYGTRAKFLMIKTSAVWMMKLEKALEKMNGKLEMHFTQ